MKIKFKASISDSSALMNFARIIHGLAKLTKSSVLRLTSDDMTFCSEELETSIKPNYRVRINQKTLFSSFVVVGNEITHDLCIQLNASNLSKSLKGISNQTKTLMIQLARKNNYDVILQLSITQPTDSNAGYRKVTHDVPIELISHNTWANYQLSFMEAPDVAFEFPAFKMLSSLVSKRRISERSLTFIVTPDYNRKEAHVEMTTFSQICKSTSKFRACAFASLDFCSRNSEGNEDQWLSGSENRPSKVSVTVESTGLHTLLSAFADSTANMIFAVCENRYALFILKQYEVQIMYMLHQFNQN